MHVAHAGGPISHNREITAIGSMASGVAVKGD
jgi:hypothetical protein